ncbi:MAG: class I SAM-dependent methyltransferase [Dysgonamonadaceae bacterium]|jgi:2-polyprenyl-3-methyl-5-hydroxy-6-metoxy-1,4-benzoquinol methylase|nr:class I SAM-dependent methyltransferase [Dysgonamonadaceae bacterium]
MTAIHIDACPICEGMKFTPFLACRDNLATYKNFSLVRCESCGFVLTQNFPDENEIGRYYDVPEYISHSDTQKGIVNLLYHFVRKLSLRSKAGLVKKVSGKTTGDLLDIGAGTGYFLNRMKTDGWKISGVEKSASAREYAEKKFCFTIHPPEYLPQLPECSQDIVSLWHVLEHLEKLNETMQIIHKLMKDNGTAIIALPNLNSVDARYYKENWAAYDVPRHLWHFSPDVMKILAEKHGFCITAFKPMYFDVFYISMLSEKNRGSSSLVGLLKGFVFFLRSLSGISKCSSVIYVLKKAGDC